MPTDGKVATKSVELDVPEGVTVESMAVPAEWTHELKRDGDRITAITWRMDVKPGEFAEFSFVARNPRDKTQIVRTLRQRFADGAVSDWTKGPNGPRPTSMTTLAPRK